MVFPIVFVLAHRHTIGATDGHVETTGDRAPGASRGSTAPATQLRSMLAKRCRIGPLAREPEAPLIPTEPEALTTKSDVLSFLSRHLFYRRTRLCLSLCTWLLSTKGKPGLGAIRIRCC
jgi:hypothetical protein